MIVASEVEESEVKKHLVQAYEMYGDTLMKRGKYEEASDMYNTMFKNCDRYLVTSKKFFDSEFHLLFYSGLICKLWSKFVESVSIS